MYSIAFHLQKGGVGKTSIAGTVAYKLASFGKTILIDSDPQSNISSWFLSDKNLNNELADYLYERCELPYCITNVIPNLDIIPSFGIGGGLRFYSETRLIDEPFAFCDLLEKLKILNYDYVVYDLSPAISRLEKSILFSCDEVITPITPEYFSIDGIEIFKYEIEKLKRNFKFDIKYNKIIINMIDRRLTYHHNVLSELKFMMYASYIIPVDQCFNKSQQNKNIDILDKEMKMETKTALNNIVEDLKNGNRKTK